MTHPSKSYVGLVTGLLLAVVAAPMVAQAQLPGTPVRYIVGFHVFPGLQTGDVYQGGTVLHVDAVLRFAAVSSTNVNFKRDAYADSNVRYVEHDGKYEALLTPNDPLYPTMYGPQQVRANLAWDTTLGSTAAKVCVVDTGVRTSHQDLGTARYLGGYDFVNNDADPTDDQGHGTHVAGTAAAGLNNAIGIAGMGNVGYYSVKVLDSGGSGWWSWVASGIRWCADNSGPRTVISMSLGGSSGDQAVADAVAYAYNTKGQLLVAASGNGWCNNCVGYPARYAEVMAVSCTMQGEGACSFHSTGPEVEISAPGNDILSTCYETTSSYCRKSGTSMSTPHVSGIAALYWSHNQAITNAQLRSCLQTSAQDLGLPGRDNVYGYGELDAKNLFDSGCGGGSARPPNDDFANARSVTVPFDYGQNTDGATTQAGEPLPCGNMGSTVWFRWTPSGSGTATFHTFGSGYDTVLAAYSGSWGSLVNLACNDDANGGYQSHIQFSVTAGVTYYVQLGGYNAATGSLALHGECAGCQGPANDNFANAEVVHGVPYGHRQSTAGATTEPGEPLPCGNMGATVWFRWTPSSSGTVEVDTFTSDYDTVLAAYTGPWSALTNIGCNDDDSSTLQSRLTFAVVGGQTYHFQVGGYNGATGTLQFNLQCSSGCGGRPTNDNFARAIDITTSPYSNTQDTTGATMEPSEPSPCGLLSASVWYKFTPTNSGTMTVDTYGSNYDTVLAGYEGAALNGLVNLACNDDSAGGLQSFISFPVNAGQTYYVQVGGYNGATGTLVLNANCSGCFGGSGNDYRRNAAVISTVPATRTQSTAGFGVEPGEPLVPPMTATAWFKYTHPTLALPRVVTVDTVSSSFDTQLAVYATDVFVPLAYNDNFPGLGTKSEVVFVAIPGVTYYLQAGGVNGATGTLVLNLQ